MSIRSEFMSPNARRAVLFALVLISTWKVVPAFGNDSAASVGVGGIQLRREARISMEKERLTISQSKVSVEYEFLNDTDKDITVEVAFPVPPYDRTFLDAGYPRELDDFRVWIDGRETKYQIDAKAMLNGVDYSGLLHKLGVDVTSLGHFTEDDPKRHGPHSPDVERLPRSQREELKRLGLIRSDNGFMGWNVVKTYHWPQTFPAHKIVQVRHVYAPILGFEYLVPEVTAPVPRQERTQQFATAIRDSCIDAALQSTLTAAARGRKEEAGFLQTAWVDYILTTANSWKMPIKSFELIVERPKREPSFAADHWFVSFCWDGSVERLDADHFSAKAINFVPKRELHIAFFGVY
jgi:hypothetical protein